MLSSSSALGPRRDAVLPYPEGFSRRVGCVGCAPLNALELPGMHDLQMRRRESTQVKPFGAARHFESCDFFQGRVVVSTETEIAGSQQSGGVRMHVLPGHDGGCRAWICSVPKPYFLHL